MHYYNIKNMQTKVVAFGNMKGGVGKSTMNSVLANFIHNESDLSVCLVDADDMQKSLFKSRERDLEKLQEKISLEYKNKTEGEREEIVSTIWDNRYDLLQIDSVSFPKQYSDLLEGKVDIVIIDLPGNLKQKGVITSYALCDYIFMPTGLGDKDLDSTLEFYSMYKSEIEPLRIEAGFKPAIIYALLNRVNKNTTGYKQFTQIKSKFPFPFFNVEFPTADAVFQKNAGTIESFSYMKKEAGQEVNLIETFCNEVLSVIRESKLAKA